MPAPTFLDLGRSIDNQLSGNIRWPVRSVVAAGSTALSLNDAQVECDATLGVQSISLPDAALGEGARILIKKVDASSNAVVVSCAVGGQLIDGEASVSISAQYGSIIISSNGVEYSVFGGGGLEHWSEAANGNLTPNVPGQDIGDSDLPVGVISAGRIELFASAGLDFPAVVIEDSNDAEPKISFGPGGDFDVDVHFGRTFEAGDEEAGYARIESDGLGIGLRAGALDPTDGVEAGIPALYFKDDGTIWNKVGAADTEWSQLVSGSVTFNLVETQVLAGDATDITFSGLNGDVDGTYYLRYDVVKGAAGFIQYMVRPNSITSNQKSQHAPVGGAVTTTNDLQFGNSGSAVGSFQSGDIWFDASTGFKRTGRATDIQYGGGTVFTTLSSLVWDETATNITSLILHADVTNGFKSGTTVSLYRLSKTAGAGSGGGGGGGGHDADAFHVGGDSFGEDAVLGTLDDNDVTIMRNNEEFMRVEETGTLNYTGPRLVIGDDLTPDFPNAEIITVKKSLGDQLLMVLHNTYGQGVGETDPASATIGAVNDLNSYITIESFCSTWPAGQDGVSANEVAVISFGADLLRIMTQDAGAPICFSPNKIEVAQITESSADQLHEFLLKGAANRLATIRAQARGAANTAYGARFIAENSEDKKFWQSMPDDGVATSWNDKAGFVTASTDVGFGYRLTVNQNGTPVFEVDSARALQINPATLGFFAATPVSQRTAVPDAAGGVVVDAEARTALNALLARMRSYGLIAT